MSHRLINFAAVGVIALSLISCTPRNPHIVGGNIYLSQGKYDEALKQFQIAVEEEPENPDARMALGKVYVHLKQHEMACQQFDKALAIDPAKIEMMKSQRDYYEPLYYNVGVRLIQTAITSANLTRDMAKIYKTFGPPEEIYTLESHGQVIIQWAYWSKGVTYTFLDGKQESKFTYPPLAPGEKLPGNLTAQIKGHNPLKLALQRFKRVTEINPNFALAYINIGYVYGKLNNEEAMLEAYQKARQIDPKNTKAQFNLALYFMTQKQKYDRAAQLLEEVKQLTPQIKDTYRFLGVCYSNQEEYAQAEQAFLKAAELDSTNKDVFFNLGLVLIEEEEYQRALDALKRAIQLDPEDTEVLFNMGIVYIMLEDYRKAIDTFTEVIRFQPGNSDAYSKRAEAKRELGLKQEAYEDFKKAMELTGRK